MSHILTLDAASIAATQSCAVAVAPKIYSNALLQMQDKKREVERRSVFFILDATSIAATQSCAAAVALEL